MADELLKQALDEQEAQLRAVDKQIIGLRELQRKRDNLHTLVSQIRFTLGLGPYIPPAEPEETTKEAPLPAATEEGRRRPVWEVARDILARSDCPLKIPELTEALYGLGYKDLVGRPGRESVRSLIRKKLDVFEKLDDGSYQLKK